ncbi:NAD-dependent epimerase/dehydratase family protein [Ramlibacter sp. AW1]|uniref:NAD-dependent epimerase/dehydratase family protein n=1 Tax=Ramlibacter aurantiacus TaxID=2801330 RepID=A0A936ZS18_9BURK|nr:NAD-dependent epimerase/dehydratase family protein [Ramlibacter aurantiacus]MBL0421511.1 NAD-dependent epimerase/dehydratase family protein [Ramlibacter aurantiacus]
MAESQARPIVLITGADGNLGRTLAQALASDYRIVGLSREAAEADFPLIECDLSSDESVANAMREFRHRHGTRIASVVHLAAYFDFTGEDNPLYDTVNVEGTRRLVAALQPFEVEQFLYASTMLVHAPCRPGEHIDERQPIEPRWAYPKSKAAAEAVIREGHGDMPYVLLRLAGVYDAQSMVPTLAQQVSRIYERDLQSHLYSGDTEVGQSMLHRDDMLDAFRRTIDRRHSLPREAEILIGEPEAMGYDRLQDELGYLIHGADDWPTLRVPKPLAAAGAWAQAKLEPVIPDAIDRGEEPFIKPFMVAMADDHYALDVRRARELLGWEPRHRLKNELPALVAALKKDPAEWYRQNGITPPARVAEAQQIGSNAEDLRTRHEALLRAQHAENRWAHLANMALGTWLFTQPLLIAVESPLLRWSEIVLGVLLTAGAAVALSWRARWARWFCAGIGALVMAVPFLFSTPNAAAYLSDTLVGALAFALAVGTRPEPGPSAIAALAGPTVPPGWSYNPSDWTQRLPIIWLAIVGLYVSRYLAAYQLGHIPDVWDPFFAGSAADPQNGTEEIITSSISKAWPVSDAAVGGYTYLLEILTGIVGSRRRWRTMPWLVVLFGLMIAPLGITSIFFIIIQPVLIGTWSTIALIGAAAVLLQIPYSLDELLATLQFLRRRVKAGQSALRVFFVGDTDDTAASKGPALADEFDRSPGAVLKDITRGGVGLPWNLWLAALIGLFLLFTRPVLGVDGDLANTHHVIGSLVLTVLSVAAAEVARAVRFLIVPLGIALAATPLFLAAGTTVAAVGVVLGVALVLLSLRRGPIRERYGSWQKLVR